MNLTVLPNSAFLIFNMAVNFSNTCTLRCELWTARRKSALSEAHNARPVSKIDVSFIDQSAESCNHKDYNRLARSSWKANFHLFMRKIIQIVTGYSLQQIRMQNYRSLEFSS